MRRIVYAFVSLAFLGIGVAWAAPAPVSTHDPGVFTKITGPADTFAAGVLVTVRLQQDELALPILIRDRYGTVLQTCSIAPYAESSYSGTTQPASEVAVMPVLVC